MAASDIKTRPWCPFCGQNIARPQHADERKIGEFPVGECQCGAVYASDATGHNVGSAMIESLVYACGDNWDLAWELIPEDDYLTGRIENYDEQTNQVVETRNLDGRAVRGVIYFVRLHKEMSEIAERVQKHNEAVEKNRVPGVSPESIPEIEPVRDPKRVRLRATKLQVKKLVEAGDINTLVDLSFDDKKTLRFIQRLLYNPVEDQRWSTAHILGQVCARLSTRKPGPVADLMHRLFEACSDSAATSWGAVEAIGSIIAARTDLYGAFTRHLLNYLQQDESIQVEVLWALGTVAESRPDLIRKVPFYDLFDLLDNSDPMVRGLSARLFGNIRAHEVAGRLEDLLGDTSAVIYYREGQAVSSSVGQLAAEALDNIKEREIDPAE